MACRPGPFTSIFSNIGKVTPYEVEQNSAISSAVPGSCPPNWLHGKPTTVSPREANCSCSFSRAVYCGVSPHCEATFTTSSVAPGAVVPSEESSPSSVFTGMSNIVTVLRYRVPEGLPEVAPGDGSDVGVHRVLRGGQRPRGGVRRGQAPLYRLACGPVLLVGDIPELHRVGRVEAGPRDRLRRERPGALDRGPVRGDRDQPVRHHVVRVQAEQDVREDVDVDDGPQPLRVKTAQRHPVARSG